MLRDNVNAYCLDVAACPLKPMTFSNFCEVRATSLIEYWALVELP